MTGSRKSPRHEKPSTGRPVDTGTLLAESLSALRGDGRGFAQLKPRRGTVRSAVLKADGACPRRPRGISRQTGRPRNATLLSRPASANKSAPEQFAALRAGKSSHAQPAAACCQAPLQADHPRTSTDAGCSTPPFRRRSSMANSHAIGSTEIATMATTTISKLSFTQGMLPKK